MQKYGLLTTPGRPSTTSITTIWKDWGGLSASQEVFTTAYEEMKAYCNNVEKQDMEAFPITRSQRKLHESSSEILTPASEPIISGNRHTQEQGVRTIVPVNDNGTIRWTNVPKQPIPSLDNVDMWIGPVP